MNHDDPQWNFTFIIFERYYWGCYTIYMRLPEVIKIWKGILFKKVKQKKI